MMIKQLSEIVFFIALSIEVQQIEGIVKICTKLELIEKFKKIRMVCWPRRIIFKYVYTATLTAKHSRKPCLFSVNIEKDDTHSQIIYTVECLIYSGKKSLISLLRSVVFIFRMKALIIVSFHQFEEQLSGNLNKFMYTHWKKKPARQYHKDYTDTMQILRLLAFSRKSV